MPYLKYHATRWSLALALLFFMSCLFVLAAQDDGAAKPGIRDYGLKTYVRESHELPFTATTETKLVCSLPYNCHFQPWIEVEAAAGQQISFNSSNPLVLYLTKTETVTTIGGVQQIEAQAWVSGEGAIYTIPAGVTVRRVQYRETGYDTDFVGSFACNDNDFNVLWQKAARTVYICMRDHFYDCPDRERVGFWGDGTPELGSCFYIFDQRSHRLCRDLVRRKLEPKFYPGQHLEFLGDYGLWFYYMHTGDLESIRAVYDQTKTFLFDTYKFGNKRTWFDWGGPLKDTAVTEVCFYYNCLSVLKKMALVTDHQADVAAIDAKMASIREDFDKRFWKGNYYQSEQVPTPDDRANAMAVNVGLASPDKWNDIYEQVLSKTMNASCFFDRWVFEALCSMGKTDEAMMRMYTRYKTMIPCTFTTLWEHYDRWWLARRDGSLVDKFDAASSLNHGWNPPVLNLSHTLAGIEPIKPGWESYQIKPRPLFLTTVNIVVPTIKGKVVVEMEKTGTAFTINVVSPAATTAHVGIPKALFTTLNHISVNDNVVWQGKYVGQVSGVTFVGEDADYITLSVVPGTWHVTAHGVLPMTSPKVPGQVPVPAVALDKRTWTATASVPDATYPFSGKKIPVSTAAQNTLDGDHWTGWRDMTQPQYAGQWLQIDMQASQTFNKIVIDNTWAVWDYPRQLTLTVSQDGITWSEPVLTVPGEMGITTLNFPTQTARFIRFTQTGSDKRDNWSVYEVDVYGPDK